MKENQANRMLAGCGIDPQRYPEKKPVSFNYAQAREDILRLCRELKAVRREGRKPMNIPPQAYKPVPVADTAGLTREEWLEYRKHGIGASDLPGLMEASEYKSVLALFEEKVSRRPLEELGQQVKKRIEADDRPELLPTVIAEDRFGTPVIDPAESFSLSAEVGKVLETTIAKYLSTRLGFPVYKDTHLYRHPHYPWLLADLDFVMPMPDPRTGELRTVIVETKTAAYWKKEDWAEGVPYGYELQCRQMMCVCNLDECLIVCLFDNNEGGVAAYRISRDYDIEAKIIQVTRRFWQDHVEREVLPTPTVPTKAAKRELARYAKEQEKWRPLPQLFSAAVAQLADRFRALHATAAEKKAAYDEAKALLEQAEMELSTQMFHHDEAVCGDLRLRWKEKTSRSMDYDAFRLAYPALYAQFVSENRSLGFEARIKQSKQRKEAA